VNQAQIASAHLDPPPPSDPININESSGALGATSERGRIERDGLAVVYDDVGANRTPDIFLTALDRGLKPLFRAQVNPPDSGKTQQLFPAAAVDPSTGALWACWYDTTFDPNAHRVWYT
jgi:hypothetical protein